MMSFHVQFPTRDIQKVKNNAVELQATPPLPSPTLSTAEHCSKQELWLPQGLGKCVFNNHDKQDELAQRHHALFRFARGEFPHSDGTFNVNACYNFSARNTTPHEVQKCTADEVSKQIPTRESTWTTCQPCDQASVAEGNQSDAY